MHLLFQNVFLCFVFILFYGTVFSPVEKEGELTKLKGEIDSLKIQLQASEEAKKEVIAIIINISFFRYALLSCLLYQIVFVILFVILFLGQNFHSTVI